VSGNCRSISRIRARFIPVSSLAAQQDADREIEDRGIDSRRHGAPSDSAGRERSIIAFGIGLEPVAASIPRHW
ncbi:hypothetical protein, partial [Paracoccus pantotrophus]|uniref:hypothetical protein n=2 Tax=Paracoccus TaxID=265 RepID=UPI001C687D86